MSRARLLSMFLFVSAAPAVSQDCSELYPVAVRSVVVVHNPINNRDGAGVVIAPRRVLTTKHILEGTNEVIVISYDRTSHTASVARRVKGQDLAVVLVHTSLAAPSVQIERSVPAPGQMLCIIGHPSFSPWAAAPAWVMTQEVTAPIDGRVTRLVFVFSPLLPGDSGGPAITLSGRVVGLVASNWGERVEVRVGGKDQQIRVPVPIGGFVPIRHACGKLIDCGPKK